MMQHAYTGESSSGEDLVFIKAFLKKKIFWLVLPCIFNKLHNTF